MKRCKIAVLAASAVLCLAGFSALGQTRVMPFGDSVTSSQLPNNSYRYWLWHYLEDKGYNVDFVGTQYGVDGGATPPIPDFDLDHEGYPGWTTATAANFADGIAAANNPEVVLLDFGGNDPADGIPPEETQLNLQSIIESIRAVNSDVVILMAIPTPYVGQDNRAMKAMRAAVVRAAKVEKRLGARVILVNLASGFNAVRDTYDGTHPDLSGEQKIARKYFSRLRRFVERQ